MVTVTEIARSAGISRKAVYSAFTGRGSSTTLRKIKHAIYQLTGGIVSVGDISMGKYSCNTFVRLLCKKIKCKKQGINAVDICCSCDTYDDGDCIFSSDSISDFRISL